MRVRRLKSNRRQDELPLERQARRGKGLEQYLYPTAPHRKGQRGR